MDITLIRTEQVNQITTGNISLDASDLGRLDNLIGTFKYNGVFNDYIYNVEFDENGEAYIIDNSNKVLLMEKLEIIDFPTFFDLLNEESTIRITNQWPESYWNGESSLS